MSAFLQLVGRATFSECVICNKPLGQDSKDGNFLTCHEHRSCSVCHHELNAHEIKWCFDSLCEDLDLPTPQVLDELKAQKHELVLQHPRCASLTRATLEQDPTLSIKQSEYDFLNMIRLMVIPNLELSTATNENNAMIQDSRLLSNMSLEEKMLHLKMMEACVAQASIAIRTDPKYRKDALSERDKRSAKQAKQQSDTSSRPVSKPADDNFEVALADFQTTFGIKSRATAKKWQSLRDKTISSFMKAGIKSLEAKNMADQFLRDNIAKGALSTSEQESEK